MELNLVTEGLKFMVLGMSTVFLFLVLMVWVLQLQFAVIRKFFSSETTSSQSTPSDDSLLGAKDASHVAAITAAIQIFRQQRD